MAMPSEGSELGSQVAEAEPVAGDAAEVAERGQSVVEGEAPGQAPVAGVGGAELPAALAACRPQLLPQPLPLLQQVQLGHRVRGHLPEPLRVQHGGGDADQEDEDLRGSKARREHPAGLGGLNFSPSSPGSLRFGRLRASFHQSPAWSSIHRGQPASVGQRKVWARGYLGLVLLAELLAGVGHGKQGQVEEGTGGADVEIVGEEFALDGTEGVAREVPAHHKPCQGEQISTGVKPPPLCHPPGTEHNTEPNLPATKVTQTCIPQEVERKSRCSSLMVSEGSVSLAMVSWMGTGPFKSARSPPNSALGRGRCRHLAARRANAVQVHKPAYSGKALELAQPRSSPSTAHPAGLQTRRSNPSYLRGRALRQHLAT